MGHTIVLKAGRTVVSRVGGLLVAGGGGGVAVGVTFSSSGQASVGAGPLEVLFGVVGFPYKDAAGGLLKLVENAGRLETGGGGGFGVLGV
jgi:hypothetical protein